MTNQEKQGQKPLAERLGARIRSMGESGKRAVESPESLPGKGYGWFRSWLQKVWNSYGGGFYSLGFAATFAYLEIREVLFDDIPGLFAINNYLSSELIAFVIDVLVDTLRNMVAGFLWPLDMILFQPPWGVIGLGLAFLAFDRYLKEPIRLWLFGEENEPESEEDASE